MTREEREDAVERLNALKQLIGYDKDSEIVKATQKSLDMAITFEEFEEYAKSHNILPMTREFYENRLKADMVAMLTEIQLQMEEYEPKWVENDEQAVASCRTWEDLDGIIQQKINALKENTNE